LPSIRQYFRRCQRYRFNRAGRKDREAGVGVGEADTTSLDCPRAHPCRPTLKGITQLDDIAAAVVFLASDGARWITGDTLRIDGGSEL
jgi:NAD(P)-dependent dehydrogenase (short-subunit alcohol dehydrogenase family)